MSGRSVWVLVLLLVCLTWPSPACAHGRDTSHSRWHVPPADGGDIPVALRISARDLERIGDPETVVTHIDVDACTPQLDTLTQHRSATDEWLLRWRMRCAPQSSPRAVHIRLFDLLGPAHVHMLGIESRPDAQVLSASDPSGALALASTPRPWWAYVALGCAHMLEGWDHLAFVLALLLAATRLRQVALLVTGFTIGHSVTLVLAALGIARPDASAVELLIAASVLILAIEEFDRRSTHAHANAVALALVGAALLAGTRGHASAIAAAGAAAFAWGYLHTRTPESPPRPTLMAAFGLIHGAGFAGVLQQTGLPTQGRVLALLSFNVGVELGQLAFVALSWPLLLLARRHQLALARPLALALAALATSWIILRAW